VLLPCIGAWQIRTTSERVGVFLYFSAPLVKPGQTQVALWIETDLKAHETGRWDFQGDHGLTAFTQSGAVYGQGTGVAVLDRATSSWRPVTGMPDGNLLGAEGDSLVFSMTGQNILRWVSAR
jgi:hypothetical protein